MFNTLSNDDYKGLWPLNQISFIEVIPSEGEERIIGIRERVNMAEYSLKTRKILIVTMRNGWIRFIRLNWNMTAFVVAEAFNGKQALQRCVIPRLTLILLDVIMRI